MARWEEESKRANELRRLAEDSARQAEHRVTLAEREATRDKQALEELRVTAAAGEDGLRKELVEAKTLLADKTRRLDDALSMTSGGTEAFWSQLPRGSRFPQYMDWLGNSIPVHLFGNQKGGVGKSTLVTNLAAAFVTKGERVLTVDIDYQGSHSSLVQLQLGEATKEPPSLVDYLFEDTLDPSWFSLAVRPVIPDKLFYIPAFYSFELIERRSEYRWALGYTPDDVRYRLARALLAPELQRRFDRILIDAPPRFTLGFVNGFCAATHLYVPTVVDQLSASAVASFAGQFRKLKALNPRVQWAGIIGTLTFPKPQDTLALPDKAKDVADAAERAVQTLLGVDDKLFIRRPVIVRDADLATATEKGVAYLNDSDVRLMFDELATEIEKKAPRKNAT